MTTLDDLKRNTNWTLQSDIQLFEYLQTFSNNLTAKTKTLVDQVEDLAYDTAETDVRLRNTFNEFLMLADTQFIENRVYDEEGEEEKEEKAPEAVVSDDPAVIIKESMALGMEALKLFFGEENETQEDMYDDIYNSRQLPFIIGTKLFIESTDAGLGGGGYSEDEEDEPLPQDSDKDERDSYGRGGDRESHVEDEETDAPSRSVIRMPPPRLPQKNRDSDDDEEDDTYNDDDYGSKPASKPSNASHTVYDDNDDEEDEEDYGEPALKRRDPYDDDDEESSASYGQKKANLANSLMAQVAARAPPKADSDDDEFSTDFEPAPKRAASHQPNKEVATKKPPYEDDDEDEEEDLFSTAKEDPYSLFGGDSGGAGKSKSKPRNSMADLFGDLGFDDESNKPRSDSVDSLFGSSSFGAGPGTYGKTANRVSASRRDSASFSALFGDTGNEDSLFDNVEDESNAMAQKLEAEKNDRFTEEDEPVKSSPPVIKPIVPKPSAGVQGLGASDLYGDGGLFGGSDDDEPLSPPVAVAATTGSAVSAAKNKFASLFGDDDDDDLFSAKPKAAASSAVSKKQTGSALFGDDDDDLFGTAKPKSKAIDANPAPSAAVAPTAKRPVSGLFGEDDDDLFSVKPKPKAEVQPPSNTAPTPKNKVATGLFDDDDDDLFSSKPKLSKVPATNTAATKKVLASSLFDDDDDLFSSKSKSVKPNVEAESSKPAASKPVGGVSVLPGPSAKKAATSDLFGDDDDDTGDLFSSKPKSTPAPAPTPTPDPTPAPAPAPESVKSAASKPVGGVSVLPAPAAKKAATSDLFGDDDDDTGDLFSSKPKSTPTPVSGSQPVAQRGSIFDDNGTDPLCAPTLKVISADPAPSPGTSIKPADATKCKSDLFGDGGDLFSSKPNAVSSQLDAAPEAAPEATEAPKQDPLVSSSPVMVNKKVSGGLASRMAGLNASQIIMPGMAPPSGLGKKPGTASHVENESGESFRDRTESSASVSKEVTAGDGTIAHIANMDRAVQKKKKRAPTKKSFTASPDETEPLASESEALSVPVVLAKKTDLFGADGDDGDLFGLKPKPAPAPAPAPVSAPVAENNPTLVITEAPPAAKKAGGLFGDDDDGDLFGSKPKPAAAPASVPVSGPVVENKPTLATEAPPAAKKVGGLFGDDDDGDLFGSKPKPAAASAPARASAPVVSKKVGGLFGVDGDDDLFDGDNKPSNGAASSTSKKSGLFGDDDDLFGSSSSAKKSVAPVPAKKISGLFGDDDDDLFGSGSKSKASAPIAKKASSLFGDDDDLFGSAKSNPPSGSSSGAKKGLFDD